MLTDCMSIRIDEFSFSLLWEPWILLFSPLLSLSWAFLEDSSSLVMISPQGTTTHPQS